MRYLFAMLLLAVSYSAVAADWVLAWQLDAQLNTVLFYVDRESIQESSGHRLAWVKETQIWKNEKPPTEKPYFLFLYEFDCKGQLLKHKVFTYDGKYNEYKGDSRQQEWTLILPDSEFRAYEKVVCGK